MLSTPKQVLESAETPKIDIIVQIELTDAAAWRDRETRSAETNLENEDVVGVEDAVVVVVHQMLARDDGNQ